MARYGMVIDITRCNGCYNCFLACRDEYCGNDYPPYSLAQPYSEHFWMRIIEKERGKYPKLVKVAYTPLPCMQCDDALCIKAAHNGEIYRRSDGIVIINPEKSTGQKGLLSSCPYRVIYWNEEKNIPQKCTFCAHLLDAGWKEPRCVEACPTAALIFGDLDDPRSEVSKLVATAKVEVLHPEYGMKEKVSYIGLPKRFVAGSVTFKNKQDECAEGATVTLTDSNGAAKKIKTDNYGDFEFEGLAPDAEYTVKLEYGGYEPQVFEVKTRLDVYLGDIFLATKAKAKATAKAKKK